MRKVIFLGILATLGCGPSKADLTRSQVTSIAVAWDGNMDFKTDATDAWGNPLVVLMSETKVDKRIRVISVGPDGLPYTHDDIESSHSIKIGSHVEEAGRNLSHGIIRGAKESLQGK